MNLSKQIAIGDADKPQAPCVFCGKVIGHINDCQKQGDNCVGCIAGAVVNDEVHYFLYCNDPICSERKQEEKAGGGVFTCSCQGYKAHDVLGTTCHMCKQPMEPCSWCGQSIPKEDQVRTTGLKDNVYCSSDCLFHTLLGDRTNEESFHDVQELINLRESRSGK